MKSMLDKLVETDTGDFYEDIIECCHTYKDYGDLLVELLEYFSGSGQWDDRVADILEEMYSEYYIDVYGNM